VTESLTSRNDTARGGVSLHLASLPGRHGIGEIGDAAQSFLDSMARMDLGVWQFLPLGPTGYGDSPYQPLSTFAGSEMLIDVPTIIRAGLVTSTEADSLLNLPASTVDYGGLIPRKQALLQRAAGRFEVQADATVKAAFDRYLDANDSLWLHDYALFRILKTRHQDRAWPEWEPAFAHREPDALRKLEAEAARDVLNIKILQFLFYRQWQRLRDYAADKGILMFGDMPIYIALDSADVWANRDLVQIDRDGTPLALAGVPPDYFSEDGQLWGNPVYDWKYHAASGFGWWADRLRQAADQADLVRIDHFRGFEAYWSVPAGATDAREGAWEPGPGDAFLDAIRQSIGKLPIVAEDLGVITPEVEALRRRHRIPGMKVLQFEIGDGEFKPGDIGADSVCYTGTHDNDTAIGWFLGSPHDIRSPEEIRKTQEAALEASNGTPGSIHLDMIRLAFSTDAWLAIAPMQDYLGLGSESRLNVPGTSAGNWRWRVLTEQLSPAMMESVARMVDDSGRSRS